MSETFCAKLELHFFSGQAQPSANDSMIMCVTITPIEGLQEDSYGSDTFHYCLQESLKHHFALHSSIDTTDVESLKSVFVKSVFETGLAIVRDDYQDRTDAENEEIDIGPDTLLPDPKVHEQEWNYQTMFEMAMRDQKHFYVGVLSNGSLVSKEIESAEHRTLSPHAPRQCLQFCKDEHD